MKKEIKIFTIGLRGNYPTIMVDPPVEYLKMCNFPQILHFLKTFIYTPGEMCIIYHNIRIIMRGVPGGEGVIGVTTSIGHHIVPSSEFSFTVSS